VYGTKSNVPDYYIKHDTVYKIISNHLGSPRLVINTISGAVVYRADYDEFGRLSASSGTLEIPFGFAGGIYDSLTGLVRFGARDYSAREGRWTAKDPIGFNGGDNNLYGYCVGDAVNRVDGNGKDFSDVIQSVYGQAFVAGCIGAVYGIAQTFVSGLLDHQPATADKYISNAYGGFVSGIIAYSGASAWITAAAGSIFSIGMESQVKKALTGKSYNNDDLLGNIFSGIVNAVTIHMTDELIADIGGGKIKTFVTSFLGRKALNNLWGKGGQQTMMSILLERMKSIFLFNRNQLANSNE
jgi:RHS repeat-associated protein